MILIFTFSSVYAQALLWETGLMVGTSHFLGEMGGDANDINSAQAGLKDIQYKLTKPSVGAFIRMQTKDMLGLRVNFIYGEIAGDDRLSGNSARHNRNLHFKSHIIELSLISDILLIKKDLTVLLNPFRGRKKRSNYEGRLGYKVHFLYVYGFIGAGIFHFNPKAEYDGKWYDLQPLGTEGQGTPEYGTKKYSRIQVCIPLGGAIQYSINKRMRIGAELSWRYTFTDYLDDASGVYADPVAIEKANGPIAAKLSNRTAELPDYDKFIRNYTPGDRRGDPTDKDSYIFSSISLTYILNPPVRNRPRFERTR